MTAKAGYVAIFGKPNAGKSTLMNVLMNYNLSIVNRKAQTTRNKILGILTGEDYQAVFLDTPGILDPKYKLQEFMVTEIKTALEEADVILYIIDLQTIDFEDIKVLYRRFERIFKEKKILVVLNKTDRIDLDEVLPVIDRLSKEFGFEKVIPVSALKGRNIDELKKVIIEALPEGNFFYDAETVTDKPERFFVGEIIRQNILDLYHEEIPYSVLVNIAEFKEREKGKDYINAEIIVERESQKIIIIGRGGEGLRKLGERSRKDIEKFLGRRIYLELFVKVRKDWRNNPNILKEIY
jgi:GTP-binding protein Era